MNLGGVTGNLTRLHLAVMGALSEGSVAASELARMGSVPKPQMTHLIDQLVSLCIVERHPDAQDRRVINLTLTDHGRALLEDVRKEVREHIKGSLAVLTPDELAKMSAALEMLREIGTKL